MPAGGAPVNVKVVPDNVYVDGSCTTPETATRIEVVDAGARLSVNVVSVPSPVNVSVTKLVVTTWFPI